MYFSMADSQMITLNENDSDNEFENMNSEILEDSVIEDDESIQYEEDNEEDNEEDIYGSEKIDDIKS